MDIFTIRIKGETSMIIGIPREVKNNENRVAITPAGVDALVRAGHQTRYFEE